MTFHQSAIAIGLSFIIILHASMEYVRAMFTGAL
jgi:hypothetical protein